MRNSSSGMLPLSSGDAWPCRVASVRVMSVASPTAGTLLGTVVKLMVLLVSVTLPLVACSL